MKKLLLFLGVLIGLVVLGTPSYALRALDSTNKTVYNSPIISSATNGNTAFVTGSVNTGAVQGCNGAIALGGGATTGILMNCGGIPITGISVSGGGSGGTVTVYDANTNQQIGTASLTANSAGAVETGPLEAVFEATVGANTQNYYDLTNAPINTNNGVVVMATSTSGAITYTSSAIASNH